MIDRVGRHRPNDTNVVGDRTEVGKQRTDFGLAVTKSFERKHRPETNQTLALQLGKLLSLCHAFGHRLAIKLCQFWLVIEGFELRRATGHRQPDDAFDFLGDRRSRQNA